MNSLDTCSCGSETFVVRATTDISVVFDASGEVIDRTATDAGEDMECATCGRVAKDATELTPLEVDYLLDGEDDSSTTAASPSPKAGYDIREGATATGAADDVQRRLAQLLAALLWDNEEYYPDVYERHAAHEDEAPPPEIRLGELTGDGRVEVLTGGREYVLSVQPKFPI